MGWGSSGQVGLGSFPVPLLAKTMSSGLGLGTACHTAILSHQDDRCPCLIITLNSSSLFVAAHKVKTTMAQGAGLPGSRLGKINLYRLRGSRNFRFKGPQAKASLLIQQVFTECLCTRQFSRSWGDRSHWQVPKPS